MSNSYPQADQIDVRGLLSHTSPQEMVSSLIEHFAFHPEKAPGWTGRLQLASGHPARAHTAELLRRAWPSVPRNPEQVRLAEQLLDAFAVVGAHALPSLEHLTTSHPYDATYLEAVAQFIVSQPPQPVTTLTMNTLLVDCVQLLGPRQQMQDYCLVGSFPDPSGVPVMLAILADGHGVFGATAARKVSHRFAEAFVASAHTTKLPEAMEQAVAHADRELCQYLSTLEPNDPDGGSTLLAAAIHAQDVHLVHIGDCRAYTQSDAGTLAQLTHEHPFEVTLNGPPLPGNLPRMLGHPHLKATGHLSARPDVSSFALGRGQVLLLASDGLAVMGKPQLEECLRLSQAKQSPELWVETVSPYARDNVTCLVLTSL